MPIWEWDTLNSEIEDMHMGGGGEVYIGGAQQHWIGGNFNNGPQAPAINFGSQNTAELCDQPGPGAEGQRLQCQFADQFRVGQRVQRARLRSRSRRPPGPYGYLQSGNSREPIRGQTADTFFTGNLTAALYQHGGRVYLAGGVQRQLPD